MQNKLFIFLSFFLMMFQFQNCSKIGVGELQDIQKSQTLEANPILPTDNPDLINNDQGSPAGDQGNTTSNDSTDNGATNSNGTANSTTSTSGGVITSGQVGVRTISVCSDRKSNNKGSNVVSAKSLELQLVGNQKQVICSEKDTAQIKANLTDHKIVFKDCKISDGRYGLRLLSDNGANLILESQTIKFENGAPKNNRGIDVLMDSNAEINYKLVDGVDDYAGTKCDETASPLYVDLRKKADDFDILSSPKRGVWFDILGERSFPIPHAKIKISWFERGKFALLALPDQNGAVTGIDQLFGNNTLGPDREFADNGFLALAKYDDNMDNIINEQDSVFNKLRLWLDKNHNGTAESYELKSLTSEDIVAIDLKYDSSFYEQDKYGNEFKYKSVVHKSNGEFKPVFDVWFAIKN